MRLQSTLLMSCCVATLDMLALLVPLASPVQADWQGRETTEEGVRYVQNSESPVGEITACQSIHSHNGANEIQTIL